MEQKDKIESVLKDMDELGMRLAQAEESVQSQREINERLKQTFGNEVSIQRFDHWIMQIGSSMCKTSSCIELCQD